MCLPPLASSLAHLYARSSKSNTWHELSRKKGLNLTPLLLGVAEGQGAKFAARGRMSGLPSLPPPVYSCREEKSCPFLDSQALADREREFSLWVSANECTILIIDCVNPVSFVCVNQQEQLRQLPYPVPIGLRQEDLDLDLEEEESAEDSEDLEEEGETLFNDDSDPMEASSVQDLAAVNESV